MSLKDEALSKMEAGLDNFRRKYAVVRHQQGLLYKEYHEKTQASVTVTAAAVTSAVFVFVCSEICDNFMTSL